MVARPGQDARAFVVRSLDDVAADLLASGSRWGVHSVFQRALNLMSRTGELLGMVLAPACNAPATLVVTPAVTVAAPPPLTEGIAPGMTVCVTGRRVDIAGLLTLDVTTARRWTPAPIRPSLSPREIRVRLRAVVRISQNIAPTTGFAPLLGVAAGLPAAEDLPPLGACRPTDDLAVARARLLLPALVAAISATDWTAAHDAARAFSGLGPGLTPAGDDVLTGLALGLRALWGGLPLPLTHALQQAVIGRTTDLAAARVRHAVAGRPDEATHAVLAALLTAHGDAPDVAVRRLIDYGHSSGVDTLVGLVCGIRLGLDRPA
jgi:hypothetical protein